MRILGNGMRPHVITLRHGGRLTGYAPFMEGRVDFGLVSLGTLKFVGNNTGYPGDILYTEVMATPPRWETVEQIFAYAKTSLRAKRWDLGLLHPASPSFFVASGLLAIRDDVSTPHELYIKLKLPDSWDAYMRSLSRNTAQNIRRRFRKLRRLGDVSVKVDREPAHVRARIQQIIENHDRFWKGTERAGWFGDGTTRQFLTASGELLARQGRFLAFALEVGGTPIAWNVGAFDGTKYYEQLVGFDRTFAPYSPGMILSAVMMRELLLLDVRDVELGPGATQRKISLGGRSHAFVRTQGYPGMTRSVVRLARPFLRRNGSR